MEVKNQRFTRSVNPSETKYLARIKTKGEFPDCCTAAGAAVLPFDSIVAGGVADSKGPTGKPATAHTRLHFHDHKDKIASPDVFELNNHVDIQKERGISLGCDSQTHFVLRTRCKIRSKRHREAHTCQQLLFITTSPN